MVPAGGVYGLGKFDALATLFSEHPTKVVFEFAADAADVASMAVESAAAAAEPAALAARTAALALLLASFALTNEAIPKPAATPAAAKSENRS